MPFDIFRQLVQHPLTDIGLERFTKDWERLQEELGGRGPRKEG
jgi:transaldolase